FEPPFRALVVVVERVRLDFRDAGLAVITLFSPLGGSGAERHVTHASETREVLLRHELLRLRHVSSLRPPCTYRLRRRPYLSYDRSASRCYLSSDRGICPKK